MRRLGSHALVWALACTVAATSASSFAQEAAAQEAQLSISPAAEARQAARDHPQTLARLGGPYRNSRVVAYVSALGQRLVTAAGDGGYNFHFYVVDAPEVFAIAQAGGYIYISRGMLALATTESEIAAVLAHEIQHVLLRHGAKRLQLRDEQRAADAPVREDIAVLNAFTRDQELEADAYSVGVLARAGYVPSAQAQFLELVGLEAALAQRSGFSIPSNPKTADSHPNLALRIERAGAEAASVAAQVLQRADLSAAAAYNEAGARALLPGVEGRDELLAAIDGVTFGRRPEYGMTVGQTYVNTRLRYSIDLPPGFHFAYVGPTLVAKGPGASTLRLDTVTWRRSQDTDLEAYIRTTSGGLEIDYMETTTVEGMDAAIARAISKSQDGYLVLGVIRVTSRTVMRFQFFLPSAFSAHMTEVARDTIRSFRRIPREQAESLEPMHIEVITVPAGATVESLAAQMRIVPHAMEWFRLLNGFAPDHQVAAGDRVKIVVR